VVHIKIFGSKHEEIYIKAPESNKSSSSSSKQTEVV
jgi:hypothetical protein